MTADNNVLLSVIVPVYNVEKYLRDCLDSLIDQTVDGGYEIICVNDGSTDNSPAILDEYLKNHPDTVRVLSQTNSGVSCARNLGIDNARGKYVTFVDSDDFIQKDSLSQIVGFLEKEECYAAVVRGLNTVSEDASYKTSGTQKTTLEYKRLFNSINTACLFFIKRSILNKHNIRFIKGVKYGEDTIFCAICNLYYEGKGLVVSGKYYNYRYNPSSAMHNRKGEFDHFYVMLETYADTYNKIKDDASVSAMLKKQFKCRIHATVANILYEGFANGKYLVDSLKKDGYYPYPFQWWTLRKTKRVKYFVLALFKFLFPIRLFYDIAYLLKNKKK